MSKLTEEAKVQAYAEMMAGLTATLVKGLAAGITRESVVAALNELARLLEED